LKFNNSFSFTIETNEYLVHLYSLIDEKFHTRKCSSFRNGKPSTIFPFGNFKLIFYLPKQVCFFSLL